LKSICFPSSCVKINWSCFSSCSEEIEVTFESPAKIREILCSNASNVRQLTVPDSVEVVDLWGGGSRGFVCNFGQDSQLRDLSPARSPRKWFGFIRLSEGSLKRIRSRHEWRERGLLG
jgi:hypothetical protein